MTVNPKIVEFHQRFNPPRLVPMGRRVQMAFGYDYANFAFIEGDDGVIVVDAGWFSGPVKRAVAAYRKLTDKPIVAIIYTHVHGDHTGGGRALVDEKQKASLAVYAPARWQERLKYDNSNLRAVVAHRALAQLGLLLPAGETGTVGSGIGPISRIDGTSHMIMPTVTIDKRTELTISGVRMVLIPASADIESHQIVWLPDEKVMFAGDCLGGTLPYIVTPRFEPDRDPKSFISTLATVATYQAEYVVPGHGRPLIGREDVEDVVNANLDVIRFIDDQVQRLILKDQSADQIIDQLKLPPHLASHPDLQAAYHKLPWLVRGLYARYLGWMSDMVSLTRHTDSEEARRLLPMLGGAEGVVQSALKALQEGDLRWAARLAGYVLCVEPRHEGALQVRESAFFTLANTTDNTIERNFLLSALGEMSGQINWPQICGFMLMATMQSEPSSHLLKAMEIRLRAEECFEDAFGLEVRVEGEEEIHGFELRRGVLLYHPDGLLRMQASLRITREALNLISAGISTWTKELASGAVKVQRDVALVTRFANLIE